MLPNVGWSELMLIMVLALVVFGPNRLPEIARQVGRAIREVRRVAGQFQDEIRSGLDLDDDFPYMKGPRGGSPTSRDESANGASAAADTPAPPADAAAGGEPAAAATPPPPTTD